MTPLDEIESLLGQVASGDRAAFRKLYAATAPRLYGLALRILRDEMLAQDVIEEVFVGLWDSAAQYRGDFASPVTWLVTITRDASIARLGVERAEGRVAGPLEITERLYASRPDTDVIESMREEARALEICLRELPRARADMLRHAYLYGATYADLAEGAGMSKEALRATLRGDLVQVRECLSR
ncbi:sigma-70 family RNA polymerase sigma factor [Mameliella sediminis]|uniref:sigma-70 family RNA polymerase sigma factor n=1 Tax=Mameliella sediminis TaxID=2836866 RepID=UPI001C47162A|nr:sigma-70 family RNA polymerase sigma factor [Mameliella sediminis]MBV7397022.1 sigma-70 family RNA polymerase sigma factor [Mameliella sediminis]MBY6116269.1 sigma-70 family RNA polymerase sigma factor [Antarctobacter heliothermus]MBY6146234.1 sigma-70 family RNA polymerase sigma factor [Mameliella alba]MCA0955419.1 sigma-70 family RNA polymerase sigma factor [Mameliella alba]